MIHNVAVVACQRHGIAHPPPPRVAVLLARHLVNSGNRDARCSKDAVVARAVGAVATAIEVKVSSIF